MSDFGLNRVITDGSTTAIMGSADALLDIDTAPLTGELIKLYVRNNHAGNEAVRVRLEDRVAVSGDERWMLLETLEVGQNEERGFIINPWLTQKGTTHAGRLVVEPVAGGSFAATFPIDFLILALPFTRR